MIYFNIVDGDRIQDIETFDIDIHLFDDNGDEIADGIEFDFGTTKARINNNELGFLLSSTAIAEPNAEGEATVGNRTGTFRMTDDGGVLLTMRNKGTDTGYMFGFTNTELSAIVHWIADEDLGDTLIIREKKEIH